MDYLHKKTVLHNTMNLNSNKVKEAPAGRDPNTYRVLRATVGIWITVCRLPKIRYAEECTNFVYINIRIIQHCMLTH